MKPRAPRAPAERDETVRARLLSALAEGPLTALDLSREARIPEREVAAHLEHVRRGLRASGRRLVVTPARCLACGFSFTKRDRLTRPGKCPVCGGRSMSLPLFSLDEAPSPR